MRRAERARKRERERREQALLPNSPAQQGPSVLCSASAAASALLLSIIPRLHVTHAYVAAYFSFLRLSLRIFHRVLSSKGEMRGGQVDCVEKGFPIEGRVLAAAVLHCSLHK